MELTNIEIILTIFVVSATYLLVMWIREFLKSRNITLLKKPTRRTTKKE